MKRSDLVVGQEYWYSKSTKWNERLYDGTKVVVVDTDCWEQPRRGGWSTTEPAPIKVKKSLNVLVDVTYTPYLSDVEKTERKVVNVMHIRGEYEPTRKMIADFDQRRKDRYQAQIDLARKQDEEANAVIELAKSLGITVRHSGSTKVTLDVADLTRLLNAAKTRRVGSELL